MGTTSSDTGRDRAALADPVARTGLPEPASPAPAERPASPEAAPPAGPPTLEPGSATGSATGSAPVAAPAADGAESAAPPRRAVRVIRNADTMEIPVHLLFREEADGGEGVRDGGRPADPFAPRPAPEAAFRTVAAPH
ncbi:SPFH domain-containing protein, partial [Streptomyces sp. McG5]|nr:SPFH domain-containing protein [Streptomyces sp. McG5]